uniref:Uncharacterized protein n=1 Tax=Tanacetum cinerariifolium TaxID=118510 RepID=A0A6L2JM79_TANCI|nr:hypothetical protein [Tanacetum cinerariifolium]
MHQTYEKSSLAMTHKLNDMIELPKSQPKETYKEDLEYEMVMVKKPSTSFKVYTPPMTYLKEVETTIGIPREDEPLDQTKLKDVGVDTCNHDIPISSKEIYNVDEPKPQPQPKPLPNCLPLDISPGDKKGLETLIKPHSPDSFRMKVIDPLTIHTPPSPHVASFHPKDIYCYYHPCVDDPKKHYGFKPGLLGQSRFLGVDISNLEVIENNFLR